MLVFDENVDVVELVSPKSISTIGIFLAGKIASSFVNVPWRTKGAFDLIMLAEVLERGDIVLTGDLVRLEAELEPER